MTERTELHIVYFDNYEAKNCQRMTELLFAISLIKQDKFVKRVLLSFWSSIEIITRPGVLYLFKKPFSSIYVTSFM